MPDMEKVIKEFELYIKEFHPACTSEGDELDMLREVLALLKEQEEREKRIFKGVCDFIRSGISTDTDVDQDYVCDEIQKIFCSFSEGGEVLMKDPYAEVWEEITKAFNKQSKMIVELAARTLSVKDYKEFVDEFSKKADNKDDLINDLMQKGW